MRLVYKHCCGLDVYKKNVTACVLTPKGKIQKVLEGANIKLSSVATDTLRVSGRAMIEAMIGRRTAEQILAEIGPDVKNQFPSAAHLCSWAGIVPGNHESAGKRKSSRTRKGNKKLRH